jgi:hypothetical protein
VNNSALTELVDEVIVGRDDGSASAVLNLLFERQRLARASVQERLPAERSAHWLADLDADLALFAPLLVASVFTDAELDDAAGRLAEYLRSAALPNHKAAFALLPHSYGTGQFDTWLHVAQRFTSDRDAEALMENCVSALAGLADRDSTGAVMRCLRDIERDAVSDEARSAATDALDQFR